MHKHSVLARLAFTYQVYILCCRESNIKESMKMFAIDETGAPREKKHSISRSGWPSLDILAKTCV